MIAAVLEHYGADLSRVHGGGWRSIKCPFHDDRTASASVSLDRNAFRCHGCDIKGSAITLIMEREGLGFVEAVGFAESVIGQSVTGLCRPARRSETRERSKWRRTLFEGTRSDL